MADKETSPQGRSVYYHRYSPLTQMTGGPSGDASYGAPAYGASAYGNAYGGSYYGGGEGAEGGGAMSLGRIIRVCSNHWMTVFVFLVLGTLAAFVIFQLLPERYEAVAYYEMSVRGQSVVDGRIYADDGGGSGGTGSTPLKEVFNTRREQLNQPSVYKAVIELYRTQHSASTVSTQELTEILSKHTEMELVPMSRLVTITVTTGDPALSADLANAYVEKSRDFIGEQNKSNSENAVAWLTAIVDTSEHTLTKMDADLLDLRRSRNMEGLQRDREAVQMRLQALETRNIQLETQISIAKELLSALAIIKEDPTKFGTLPESIPRASEIATSFQRWQQAAVATKTLLTRLTENHPDVKASAREEEVYREQFVETAKRAYETSQSEVAFLERQRQPVMEEASSLRSRVVALDGEIISAEMALQQLERARSVELEKLTSLRERARVAELKTDENAATIKPVRAALPPEEPSSPNPYIVFPAGVLLGGVFGILFVLLLDHMEDKLVGISDIEQRLRLKALAVFPHLRRKQRAQISLVTHNEPFSQYAESMAGLRNLLDSARYHDQSKVVLCMSTQPAEGKTCTSCNLAISYAQSGQRTLLVDFDMRRPRMAGIFGRNPNEIPVLPHTLAKNDPSLFEQLPQETQVPNLSLVYSRASMSISPSMLMGTNIITEFFDWARRNYDHIIIDSPPFGLVGDVIVLANLVDAVLLVATPDKTRFAPMQFAVRRLTEVGARLLGVVVNNVDFGRWSGFGKYEVRYGYSSSTYVPHVAPESAETPDEGAKANAEGATPEATKAAPDQRPVDSDIASVDD